MLKAAQQHIHFHIIWHVMENVTEFTFSIADSPPYH